MKMKIPNFDDKDLAITGIVMIAVVGFLVGWGMGVEPTALYPFGGTCVTGIAALATGRKKEPPVKPS